MPRGKTKPSPTVADYWATRTEQGCLQISITLFGVVAAFIVSGFGALLGLRELYVVAGIILFVGLAVGIFVGHDVNYGVARMRERAEERAKEFPDQ